MLKYIFSFLLVFTLIACETEETTETSPGEAAPAAPGTERPVDQSEIAEVTDEELEKFARAMVMAEEKRISSRSELRELLAEVDMEMWRYEEIEAASQRDRELRQRSIQMMREIRENQ